MIPERGRRVYEIFQAALGCDPARRPALLDELCDGDGGLRAEAERLLAADATASRNGFLGPSGFHRVAAPVKDASDPTTIDLGSRSDGGANLRGTDSLPEVPGYLILGKLGYGGMGTVLRGRDPRFHREVAVKVLMDRHRADPEMTRRFVEEAQIGGQLQHPGIVPVYDLGALDDDRPYFTMKLIRGRTLADLLAERSSPADDLPRFLTIFEQVCQAVAFAHARRVIHRDLKPSNVMVGRFGEVQVMDWGFAKVLSAGGDRPTPGAARTEESVISTVRNGSGSENSLPGTVMGTPAYMPPEQSRGEVDAVDERTDVFGLGAILCVILTGSPPFVGPDSLEVLRKSAQADLTDARARLDAAGVDAALVGLARDCLEVQPRDRPRDAGAVADRVTAYLEGVQERLRRAEMERAQAQVRAEEERKRRKLAVALASAILALAVLGGGGASWYTRQRQARLARFDSLFRAAVSSLDRAEIGEKDAPAEWEKARVSLGQAEEVAGAGAGAAAAARLQALRDRFARARKVRALLASLETVRAARSEHLDLGRADLEYADAFRQFGFDLDVTDPGQVGAAFAGRSSSVEIAAALDDWVAVRRARVSGRDDPSWRRLVTAAQVADPDPWRNELRSLLDRSPADVARATHALAADAEALARQSPPSLARLAETLRTAGEPDRAVEVLRLAWRQSPSDFWVNLRLGMSSWSESRGGHFEQPKEALRFLTAAVAARPTSAAAHNNLGLALQDSNDFDDTIGHRSLRLARSVRAPTPPSLPYREGAPTVSPREAVRLRPDDPTAHMELGNVLRADGKLDDAIAEYRTAARLVPGDAEVRFELAWNLWAGHQLDDAITEFREVARLRPDDPTPRATLDATEQATVRLDDAIAEYRAATRLKSDLFEAHVNLGIALRARGRPAEAIDAHRTAVGLRPDDAMAHDHLGLSLRAGGQVGEAIAEHRVALGYNPNLFEAHVNLGDALRADGKLDDAIAEYRAAVGLRPDDPAAHCALGLALRQKGDQREASEELSKATELGLKLPGWRSPITGPPVLLPAPAPEPPTP
jgi:serine/threonine-protein kinase